MLDQADTATAPQSFSQRHPTLTKALAGPTLAIATNPRESVQGALEGGGAAAGAGIGSMAAGLPGAAVLGAGGARMGRAIGQVLTGEAPHDLGEAAIAGALGPVFGRAVQWGARLLARVPSQKGAQRIIKDEVLRQEAHEAGVALKGQVKASRDLLGRADAELAKMREHYRVLEASRNPLAGEMGTAAQQAEKEVLRLRGDVMKILKDPENAIEYARSKVAVSPGITGMGGVALGAFLGHVMGGLESTIAGGSIGYLVGRLEGKVAAHLAANQNFVRWATGLRGRTLNDAIGAYITDVWLRGGDAEDTFLGELIDLAAGVTAGAAVTNATGSVVAGMGAGALANSGMEQARSLADDIMRAGERAWDELFGAGEAEGE